jgi:hypothetical protein
MSTQFRSLALGAPLAIASVLLAAACSAPAAPPTASPIPSPVQLPTEAPTAEPTVGPTDTPLVLVRTEVPGLAHNSVTFAGVEYSVTDAFVSNQEPRNYADGASPVPSEGSHAFVLMAGNNTSPRRPEVAVADFSLQLADGTAIEATDLFGRGADFMAPAASTAADGFLVFEVEPTVDLTAAGLRIGKAPDRPELLMLTGVQPPPAYPVVLEVSGEARGTGVTNGGNLLYTLLGGGLHIDNPLEFPNYDTGARANEDELFLVLDIRIMMESGRVEGTFADQFRLIVDGAPRAPWNSPAGDSIGPGAAVDTQVGWLIPAETTDVVLQVGDPAEDPGTIPITLPAE